MSFWQLFILIAEAFLFVAYLVVLFHVIGDIFRDRDLSGGAKALWMLVLILVPVLAAFVYLIVRGRGMAERQQASARSAQEQVDAYIREVAAVPAAQQIATAKELLDSGALTQEEFPQLKARALAATS